MMIGFIVDWNVCLIFSFLSLFYNFCLDLLFVIMLCDFLLC